MKWRKVSCSDCSHRVSFAPGKWCLPPGVKEKQQAVAVCAHYKYVWDAVRERDTAGEWEIPLPISWNTYRESQAEGERND